MLEQCIKGDDCSRNINVCILLCQAERYATMPHALHGLSQQRGRA